MNLNFDMRDFERAARNMGIFAADQLPFALAHTLNHTMLGAGGVREHIVRTTFPRSFKVHNQAFANAAFVVEKARKDTLSATLFDRLKRGQLERHAAGGVKSGRGMLAVPNRDVSMLKRGAKGVRPRPRDLDRKVPGRALRVLKGKGIFIGEGGRLRAAYWFKSSARIQRTFPFARDFETVARRQLVHHFPTQMQRAFDTAMRR